MTTDLGGYLYRSRATRPASLDGEIYLPARRRNRTLGVTGFLHREGDAYFQYLEGRAESLRELAADIARDPRHSAFDALFTGPASQRLSGSAMGYTTDADIDWSSWARDHGLEGGMWNARAPDIIAFLGSYGDPSFRDEHFGRHETDRP